MAWPEIPPLVDRGFRAATKLGEAPEIQLGGSADIAAVEALESLIGKVHAAMLDNAAHAIELDIQALEFMSATCFNVLVNWISMIQDLDAGQRYVIAIHSNPKIPWQRRSLQTLACFATDLVTVA
jgi:hypothetical protein